LHFFDLIELLSPVFLFIDLQAIQLIICTIILLKSGILLQFVQKLSQMLDFIQRLHVLMSNNWMPVAKIDSVH
jgi:hypothetical protein